ncbi:L-cysteine desulfidase family protein [Candidatus Desulfosporosinus nitrosoreducens]|uniref:L-cysteine desulfidase family protein n=1 Tax=Candidatus Desulfosporosinus nitrosoreducens TaxID=3401928 RepID=UPI00280BF0EA|nr:L-serine ammonia-lyase, iron-sulfur-dependent, subunit alpha [Desulfosporosinus sp. PR]
MHYVEFLRLLEKELVVALGCTEPVAIAYAAALARKHVKGDVVSSVSVLASANVIKNAMAVTIPGTKGSGVNLAAALGVVAGDASKGLEVLNGLMPRDVEMAKEMIKAEKIRVDVADTLKKLYIEVVVATSQSSAKVVIADEHTQVVYLEADGDIILDRLNEDARDEREKKTDSFLSLDAIWDFVQAVDLRDLGIIEKAIELNTNIAMEGLANEYGLQVGKTIQESVRKGIFADDLITQAMALTAGASDARMSGSTLPVMSNSGSGNQGISATLPVVAVGQNLHVSHEQLLRAVTLSNLIAIYIKTRIGRLSALCGATASGTGASCGIAYLLGGGKGEIKTAIQNMQGNVSGMFCDGAKAGCALKLSTCTSTAVQSAIMAMAGIAIQSTDGIIESTAEQTIENLGRLAAQGSREMDRIILDIMVNKKVC